MSTHKERSDDLNGAASPAGDRRSGPEGELPAALRALEAQLASLVPRSDLLYDELLYRAGQMSVGGEPKSRLSERTRWGWPAGFAAMTAVAATLLVMRLTQPGSAVIERYRIVELPVLQHLPPSESVPLAAWPAGEATNHDSLPEQRKGFVDPAEQTVTGTVTPTGWLPAHWYPLAPTGPVAWRNELLTRGPEAWDRVLPDTPAPQPSSSSTDRRAWLADLLNERS